MAIIFINCKEKSWVLENFSKIVKNVIDSAQSQQGGLSMNKYYMTEEEFEKVLFLSQIKHGLTKKVDFSVNNCYKKGMISGVQRLYTL